MQLLLLLLLPVTVGALAGWLLALWPTIVLTAIAVGILLWLGNEMRHVPGGTSGGIGIGILQGMIVIFLIVMWVTYAATTADWSGMAASTDWSSIRKLLFK